PSNEGTLSVATGVDFKVLARITGFLPPNGAVGSSIVITGTSLSGVTSVKFGSFSAITFANDLNDPDGKIVVTVPVGAITSRVSIVTAAGPVTSSVNFIVSP